MYLPNNIAMQHISNDCNLMSRRQEAVTKAHTLFTYNTYICIHIYMYVHIYIYICVCAYIYAHP